MYKVILVPLDGSKRAERILPYVEDLSQKSGGKVILLQIVEPIYSMGGGNDVAAPSYSRNTDKIVEGVKNYLETKKKHLEERKMEVEICIGYGPVVGTIMEVAKKESADIIAIASHGRSGIGRVFFGSVAAGLLHRVDRPILIIRSRRDE